MKTLISAIALLGFVSPAAAQLPTGFELSAPVFPKTSVLYQYEGSAFPDTPSLAQDAVQAAALVYEPLLTTCAAVYPEISVAEGATELSIEQLRANYDAVARCAYEQYTAKPYWISGLVDQVDICGVILGTSWRLPTEGDLSTLTSAGRTCLTDTLQDIGGTSGMGNFYFNLKVFLRGSDGLLKTGDFGVDGLDTASLLPETCLPTYHCEAAIALRCIRSIQE